MSDALFCRWRAPIGELCLVGELAAKDKLALRGIYFANAPHAERAIPAGAREDAAAFTKVIAELGAYFRGERTSFVDLVVMLAPGGTPFQRAVWSALSAIPFGETRTYSEVARVIGRPRAVRAVGAANGQNPLSIVVPCHRVIGKDGALTGYAGGVANKRALLELEASVMSCR